MDTAQKQAISAIKEEDYLFDKSHECPVCKEKFKAKTVKSGRARQIRADKDLRPVHENIEPLKYEPIVCPHCGYAALSRYFENMNPYQAKAIREQVSKTFQPVPEKGNTYTYGDALWRYQLCLASAAAKNAKASEKAYINLKSGWLLRSMVESLDKEAPDYEQKASRIKEQERAFLKKALDGFLEAKQTESYPMCGMDENTADYLLAVLAMEFEQYDITSRIISGILTSVSANSRMKDKARDMKEELIAKMKAKKSVSGEGI